MSSAQIPIRLGEFVSEAETSRFDALNVKYAEYLQENSAGLVPFSLLSEKLDTVSDDFPTVFYQGKLEILKSPTVSVVGTRSPSADGTQRAGRVSRILVELGYVVMSGLAKGIDAVAHRTALDLGGKTIAVFGTPIHKVYPAENKGLARDISKAGLILSAAEPHEERGKYLFPRRNRLMAALSEATVIIEAGPTSGVVHQAAECLRRGKKLILLKSLVDNKALDWVAGFQRNSATIVIESGDDLKKALA